jgi:hypothetical protein
LLHELRGSLDICLFPSSKEHKPEQFVHSNVDGKTIWNIANKLYVTSHAQSLCDRNSRWSMDWFWV